MNNIKWEINMEQKVFLTIDQWLAIRRAIESMPDDQFQKGGFVAFYSGEDDKAYLTITVGEE